MFRANSERLHHQMYGAACPPHTLPITIYLTRLLTPTGVGGYLHIQSSAYYRGWLKYWLRVQPLAAGKER